MVTRQDFTLLICLLVPLVLVAAVAATFFPPFRPAFNFAIVLNGKAYRTGRIGSSTLNRLVHTYRIRSLVILDAPSKNEALIEMAKRLSLHVVTLPLRDKERPRVGQMLELLETIDQAPSPVLFYDFWGAYKSALASAFYLIVREGESPTQARRVLSFWNGYVPWGPQAEVTRPLQLYVEWRETAGIRDGPEAVRRWLSEDYHPERARGDASR